MRTGTFLITAALVGLAIVVLTRIFFTNEYFFFAAYVVLQYIVLSTAWNILGGYTGYINFGTGAFFAIGAYSSAVLHKLPALLKTFDILIPAVPLPVMIVVGGIVSGIVGLGTGYLTLRLRGVFFAIATLALSVVVQTLIVNWDYVGGSRGIYIIRPAQAPLGGGYIQYLYTLMMALSVISVCIARWIERSRLGLGFAAIRDDELAAEAGGVPTLRLKLIATTLSGALMGMAGAPLPYYVTYLDPGSSFNLAYAVNSVAMPVIGGMTSWVGPIIGAVILGTIQQLATVTISSALNLLIVGVLLILFVIIAPNGIMGLISARQRRRAAIIEAAVQQRQAAA
ncbi:MAG: branched-chain amino acid ABC transporter permease [Alphaproteobacteria bacterium]|nr:MAG: branched-chain amino acid ABC transporter permease [Alphaproteobacteria bacterium]